MTDSSPGRRRGGRAAFWIAVVCAVAVVAVDQLTKLWAASALADGRTVDVIGSLIRFQLAYNTGAAFSSGPGFTWVFGIVSGVVAAAIVVYAWRVTSVAWAIGLGALLGGAISHFGDRLLRGYVIDFIDYVNWFIGNVADIAIVLSVVYLGILAVLKVPTGRSAGLPSDEAAPTEPRNGTR
ncbi:signal peptidase II [Leifsonia sp. NPDC080035]|uniref:Lipoprotein signal peptidase n=1 Tax=Leifsonia sp. NPDC080035 TaxID=3143936 RepID=A0AAU7GBU4_9MICO